MKLEVVLKPCPWCYKTPDIWMPIEGETWCWSVWCKNEDCGMQPRSPHIAIRKTTKTDYLRFFLKVGELADKWNRGNLFSPTEAKAIDLDQIWDKFTTNRDCIADRSCHRIQAVT